jgi:hypothetical protein
MSDEETPVRLARIEEKLDQALDKLVDHENRVRFLERALWVAFGMASLLGAIGQDVVSALGG